MSKPLHTVYLSAAQRQVLLRSSGLALCHILLVRVELLETMKAMGRVVLSLLVGIFCSQLPHCAGKRTSKDWSKVCVKKEKILGVFFSFSTCLVLDLHGYLLSSFFKPLCLWNPVVVVLEVEVSVRSCRDLELCSSSGDIFE